MSAPWQIGFDHEAVSAFCIRHNPGWVPIVAPDEGCAFGAVVAMTPDREHAEKIVRAVNAHEDLLEACKDVAEFPTVWVNDPTGEIERGCWKETLENVRAAISKAEEGSHE